MRLKSNETRVRDFKVTRSIWMMFPEATLHFRATTYAVQLIQVVQSAKLTWRTRGYVALVTLNGEVASVLKHYAMKTYGIVEMHFHTLLTSVLDGGKCSASRPGHFTPRSKGSRYPFVRRERIPTPAWGRISVVQLIV